MNKKNFSRMVLRTIKIFNKKIKTQNCEISIWQQNELTKEKNCVITLWIELWNKETKKRYFSKQIFFDISKTTKKQLKKDLISVLNSFIWEKQKH